MCVLFLIPSDVKLLISFGNLRAIDFREGLFHYSALLWNTMKDMVFFKCLSSILIIVYS